MTRRRALALVALAAVAPRLAALLAERGAILASFTEKSDDFARTFVASGTYGFIPGHPSANTQPLYGWFLIPIYWIAGRHWWSVGLVQIAVAAGTALLVYEIGRRYVSPVVGLVAALVATLNPYLIWHDVHVNREIVDQPLAAALVLLALAVAERRSLVLTGALGAVGGLAVLGNTRLIALPVALAAWQLPRRFWTGAAVLLAASALVVSPWVIRNRVQLGCFALTTDARALWKANNVNTYRTLAQGTVFIDEVPPLPGAPPTPELAGDVYKTTGRIIPVDECAQLSLYQGKVWEFWRDHPGEKAKLAAQATGMLWNPKPLQAGSGANAGGHTGLRTWTETPYAALLFLLGLAGLAVAPRRVAVLVAALLAYQTVAAMVFAGQVRYRAPWDFAIALLAAAALVRLRQRWRA